MSSPLFVQHPDIEELSYYTKRKSDNIEKDYFHLLGFKDNHPVVESASVTSKSAVPIKILKKLTLSKFQFDESGEKYINLNGQKLKVVPQGKIPEEVRKRTMLLKHQMINIGSLKKPLKVRVISGATQIYGAETQKPQSQDKLPLITPHDNNPNKMPTIKKIKLISNKVLKPTSSDDVIHTNTSPPTAFSVIPKVVPVKSEQVDKSVALPPSVLAPPDADYLVPLYYNSGTPRVKLLTENNLKILNQVKMQALNLSKKKMDTRVTENGRISISVVDIAVQTDNIETLSTQKTHSDQIVQTDIQRNCQENVQDLFDLDWLSLLECGDSQSPILNNVNFGNGPSILNIGNSPNTGISVGVSQTGFSAPIKSMGPSIGGKQFNEEKMKKQVLFFTDLRECLVPNVNGNLPIHEGVIKNDRSLVKRMCIAMKARKNGVNIENHNGCTPLQLAVINDAHVDIVQTLLDAGADITEADGEGNNILHLGAKFERHKVLEVILFHPIMSHTFNCINSFNFDGLTPLMICCMSSWPDGAILFIEHGANVNLKDQTSGRTALFHAAEAMNVDIVRLLLDHKADPKIKNFFGTSPHDAMYELEDMPDRIKNLIFGKTKRRTIEAEMNPLRTAKAAKSLKTFSKLQKIERRDGVIMSVPGPPYKLVREIK